MHLQYHHYILIVSVLCFELFENFCDACGCTTHNEIARRAYYWFNNHSNSSFLMILKNFLFLMLEISTETIHFFLSRFLAFI